MARQQQQNAQNTYNTAGGIESSAQTNANQLYSSLFPQFTAEATNPQGFSPSDLSAMNTASQQSVGGSTAGAVGQGNLTAARTRNSGGFGKALDASVKTGQQTLSQNALGIQGENASLKQAQKQQGLSGLQSLYGNNTSQMLGALGLQNQATQAGTQAGQSGWFQNLLGFMGAGAAGANAGMNIARG